MGAEQCFCIVPEFTLCRMIQDMFRQFFLFAVGIAAAAFAIHIFRQGKVYGCCRSLQRGFDERAEQNICQRVEPGIHRDHICTNDTGIGGIDGDSFFFYPFASSRVKSNKASFVFPYTDIRLKRPFFPLVKKSDSILPMA